MKSKPLVTRFAAGLVVVLLFAWALWAKPVKKGIDLEGGHSLIFKINTEGLASVPANLPSQIIDILKERVDPQGLMNLEWRPVGADRIEARMPVGSDEARRKQQVYVQALEALENTNLKPGDVNQIIRATGAERADLIARKAGGDPKRLALLGKIAGVHDDMGEADRERQRLTAEAPASAPASAAASQPGATTASQPAGGVPQRLKAASDRYSNLQAAYAEALETLRASNIPTRELANYLTNLYVSPKVAKQLVKEEVEQRGKQLQEKLADYSQRYLGAKGLVDAVSQSFRDWADVRGRLDDPQDLVRLVRRAGVLEFRIGPRPAGSGYTLDAASQRSYLQQLKDEGPQPGRTRNDRFQWFKIRGNDEKYGGLIVGLYGGDHYLLLANEPGKCMLRRSGERWNLDDAYPTSDRNGMPAVGFTFDDPGSMIFAALTGNNKGELMAILLDDEVFSAPVIRSQISKSGIIEGNFTRDEVSELVRTLDSGSLPARVNPDPVSVTSIGATLGQANIQSGLRAAYIALLAVAIFMAGYYLLAGLIADFAMALNIVLLMGAMALFEATFTLPGIAGVILTMGMAVDANVLIYERLREEQDRGLPIKMAIKVAYQRAMSAIIDSNLTTLLTCVILAWVGTQEVRGFAITLGVGLAFSMFTALLVTRWIFDVLLESKLLKGYVPMLRLIHVPKIDWMRKRYYFWAFSLLTGLAGLAGLFAAGSNIWGLEFRKGARAVVRFNDDAMIGGLLLNDDRVANRVREVGEKLGIADMTGANVQVTELRSEKRVADFLSAYDAKDVGGDGDGKVGRAEWQKKGRAGPAFELLDANRDGFLTSDELKARLPEPRYEISTGAYEPKKVREVVDEAFPGLLNVQTKVDYTVLAAERIPELNVAAGPDGITLITRELASAAGAAYRDQLGDNVGGALFAVTLTNPQEAMTVADFRARLRSARLQVGTEKLQVAEPLVLPLTSVGNDRFSSFAEVVRSDEVSTTDPTAWAGFAQGELTALKDGLSTERSLESLSTFDPALTAVTSQLAIVAVVLSWLGIIIYLWFRFGQAKWGLAAVICLIHDTFIITGLVAISNWLAGTPVGKWMLVTPFKIDMSMIAAILTVIGYSVNDTIVVFDRIRENRGRLTAVNAGMINLSINQTLSRTILTSFTVFLVVFIMYIWGGDGIHGFSYALLAGVFFGTYSSIAVAAPILMVGSKRALAGKPARVPAQTAKGGAGK